MNLPDYIVDSHVHFWNPLRLNYPWLASVPALDRVFLPEDYAVATQTANIGKMVFVECGCEPSQNHDEVRWISGLAAWETRIKGIVAHASLEHGAAVRDELAALAQFSLVKGVRRNLQGEADANLCLQPAFVMGVRALAEFDFSFDLCVVHHQLLSVIELVQHCPEVNFILDHCGKPAIRQDSFEPWATQLKVLAALPNVCCKISGLVTEANPAACGQDALQPYVAHALDCFGFNRVVFGGDWPVCHLAMPFSNWLAMLGKILAGVSNSNQIKFFQINSERIYRV